MPELPEVETITSALRKVVVGKTIIDVFLGKKNLRYPFPVNFKENIIGQTFGIPYRRAKYCIMPISNNQLIILHLGMSGQIRILNENIIIEKHDHAVFYLDEGLIIKYNDPRRFGFLNLTTKNLDELNYFKNIGPEPNSNAFNKNYLTDTINNKKTPIKNFLMNQKVVAGLGNIYVNEALYLSKISPKRPSNELTSNELESLVISIKEIISNSIKIGGTTLRNHIQPNGKIGYFANKLKVYGKINTLCNNCNTKIKHIKLSGRSTFFCGFCQK